MRLGIKDCVYTEKWRTFEKGIYPMENETDYCYHNKISLSTPY